MASKKILVVGDIILDRYITVTARRRSQEDPSIFVWEKVSEEDRLGGAANVAHNLKKMGGDDLEVHLVGLVGGTEIFDLCHKAGIDYRRCIAAPTMIKTRWVTPYGIYLARYDDPVYHAREFADRLDEMSFSNIDLKTYDAVVVSDYDKGTIIENIGKRTTTHPICVVDSKRQDLSMFRGSTVIKVNEPEYNIQLASKVYQCPEELAKFFVVTRGSKGCDLIVAERLGYSKYKTSSQRFPSKQRNVVDPTGCGDTHTAALAFSLANGSSIEDAIGLANDCAGKVVEKFGTSTI